MRPRLAPKVRLRKDAKSGRYLLLYPERGMQLNATGSDIAELCTGEATVGQIVDVLTERYKPAERETVEREVLAFLNALYERALVVDASGAPA
jgi:pyrroloquinoline quinone biosynthesis protein D